MKRMVLLILVLTVVAVSLFTNGCGKDDGNARPGDKGTFTFRGSGSS